MSSQAQIRPPGLALQLGELTADWEYAQCLTQLPWLLGQGARGQGQPVVVLPGFMTSDASTVLLRWYLQQLGYAPEGWGLGRSTGTMLQYLEPVKQLVAERASATGQPVRLVGWSRGGMLAREVARDHPELVERVITLASPVRGGVQATSIQSLVRSQVGPNTSALWEAMKIRQQRPIQVPVTALYSKTDGVVAWQACIDNATGSTTEHIEVTATHAGIGCNAQVYRWLAKLLT